MVDTIDILSLPVAVSLSGSEYAPVVQGGTTKRAQTSLFDLTAGTSGSSQTANTVYAGPISGAAAPPTFRALVSDDLPIVPATKGGTGQSSYTIGDTLYASSTTALSKLAAGTSGYHLQAAGAGVAPAWAGFTQGGTGAVTRTWTSKAQEIVSPEDFGTITLDDTTAAATNRVVLQRAIDYSAANGKILRTQGDGICYVKGDLKTRSNLHWISSPGFVLAPTEWSALARGEVVTLTIASPCVATTATAHNLSVGDSIYFSTLGSLPTGITAGTVYYVISVGFTSTTFQFSTSLGGSAVNASGSQSGTQYVSQLRAGGGGFIGNVFATNDTTERVQSDITLNGLVVDGQYLPATSRGYARAATAGPPGTITLTPDASATDQFYRGQFIRIFNGTGSGSTSYLVTDYNGTTKVATISTAWSAGTPDTTSYYVCGSNDNAIGFARGARRVRILNCRMRNFPSTWVGGGGGKGIQYELGVHDSFANGNVVEDCGFGYSVQGDSDNYGPPTDEDSSATGILFLNNTAKRCETGILASGYDIEVSPAGTAYNLSFIFDGVFLEDCGAQRTRPATAGVKGGPVVLAETANGIIDNLLDVTTEGYTPYPGTVVTVTIATPGVVTWTAHGMAAGDTFCFATTGALPTGITAGTTYYVIATGLTADTFQFSATSGGAAVNTSGSQSGTHYGSETAPGTVSAGITGRRGSFFVGWARTVKGTGTAVGDFDSIYTLTNPAFIGDDANSATFEAGIPQSLYGFNYDLTYCGAYMARALAQDASGGSANTKEVSASIKMTFANGRSYYCVPSAASPCVVTTTLEDGVTTVEHGLSVGDPVFFTTTDAGTLMSGLTQGTTYYVISAGLTDTAFEVSATRGGAAVNTAATVVTITQANPGVVTWNSHGLPDGATVVFATTGSLPGGGTLVPGTTYYVANATTNTFEVAATEGGASISTAASAGAGTQSAYTTIAQTVTASNVPDLLIGTNMAHAALNVDAWWTGPNGIVRVQGPAISINRGTSGGVYSWGYNAMYALTPGTYTLMPESGGNFAFASYNNAARFVNTYDAGAAQWLRLELDSASPANTDYGYTSAYLSNNAGTAIEFARQSTHSTTITAGAEEGATHWWAMAAGTLTDKLTLTSEALNPTSSAGLTLGTTALPFGVANVSSAFATTAPVRAVNVTESASVRIAAFEGDRALPGANDTGYISVLLSNSGGTQTEFFRLSTIATTVTDASEASIARLAVQVAGTLTNKLNLSGTALYAHVNDGLALGTVTEGFSDLHGATGFTLNIANGDWLATHTTGVLTVGTGDLRVTTAGTNAASVVTVDGTQTLTNKTLTSPSLSSPTMTTPAIGVATGTSLTATGVLHAYSGTAIPAGGTAGTGFVFSSVANFGVFFGSGAPSLSAAQGSLYLRSDGSSTSTRLYVNTDGATAWTNVTTAT